MSKTEPPLQVIDLNDGVPQIHDPHERPVYPEALVAFTDSLHDAGHLELGIMVLEQWTRLERLMRFGQYLIEIDE